MTTVKVLAPAKINLTLHITGQRDDGYHLLDSLVVFSPVSDRLVLSPGHPFSLTIEGPEAKGVPGDLNNSAMKAARVLDEAWEGSVVLEKHLPAAAGIGGGSADAAAVLRTMLVMDKDWTDSHFDAPDEVLKPFNERILALGADVPMCLLSKSCRARGIGEKVTFTALPTLRAILVNPRVPVSTASVFGMLEHCDNAPMPEDIPRFKEAADLIDWVSGLRNDLEAPAIKVAPVIEHVLDVLRQSEDCQLARMSGSGATCFGLYPDPEAAVSALKVIRTAYPDWWVMAGDLGDQMALAMPKIS
ncbi:MAG: 4-(cytidine 5'-diphospho)-2-C-methyl-D-erythritol kinase [Silicimonas sp.]|nr:4-(cytidine 5'-diphospho)-2-C-methyl-D-erythritol kinase [Silicimonas sp.]